MKIPEDEKKAVDDDVIVFDENAKLTRIYDYLPYTFWRIQRILDQVYSCRLENIWQGYKANRRPRYQEIYKVISNYDDEVILNGVCLDTLRRLFARENIPLHDEKNPRNPKAEKFLEMVEQLPNKK